MRTIRSSRFNICKAEEGNVEIALNIMNQVMGIKIETDTWNWLTGGSDSNQSFLALVFEKGIPAASLACYVRNVQIADGVDMVIGFIGQLCAAKSVGMRRQGAALELLLWCENKLREDLGVSFKIGLVGSELYDSYYGKYLGYSKVKGRMTELHYYSLDDCIKKFCSIHSESQNNISFSKGKLIFKVESFMGESKYVEINQNGLTILPDNSEKKVLCIYGMVWPLFRYLNSGISKKNLIHSIVTQRLKIKNWLMRPDDLIKLLLVFAKMTKKHEKK